MNRPIRSGSRPPYSRWKLTRSSLAVLLLAFSSLPALAEDAPRFDVERYTVEGNSLLPAAQIDRIVQPYTGKQKDFGDVQQALEALDSAYRSAGYSAVQVTLPEQKLERGVIHFKIIETRIGKVLIEGNQHFDTANIRNSLPALREGIAPNANAIAANLRVANENTVKQTQVILRSGDTEGQVDALVKVVDDKPWKGFVTLDNTGNKATGVSRLSVGYQHANLANRDQVLTLQYTASPEKLSDVSIYGLGYRLPLYRLGDTIEIFGGYSDVNSGVVSNLFTVSGKGATLGARYNHTLERIETYQHKLSFGLDYRAYQNNVIMLNGGTSLIPDYTVHPISIAYAGQWQMPAMSADLSLSLLHNLPAGSKSDQGYFDDPANATLNGKNAKYTLYRLGGSYARQFPGDWQTRVALSGQYTRDPLVTGEQFGLGGASSVRGFAEREIANDNGYRGSLEFYSPDFGKLTHIDRANLRALVFTDFGRTTCNQPCVTPGVSLASLGAGLRFNIGKDLSAGVDYAYVIDPAGVQGRGDEMLHINFGLIY